MTYFMGWSAHKKSNLTNPGVCNLPLWNKKQNCLRFIRQKATELNNENKSKAILDGSKASRKQGASNVVLVESSVLSDAKVWNCRFFDSKANGPSTLFIILKGEMMIKKVSRVRPRWGVLQGWPPLDFYELCWSTTALSKIWLALLL